MVWRGIGGVMLLYSGLYVAQYWFSVLYDNPQRVWDVMNVVSGAGILLALLVNLRRVRSQRESHLSSRNVASPTVDPRTTERLGALALLYANGTLAIWYVPAGRSAASRSCPFRLVPCTNCAHVGG